MPKTIETGQELVRKSVAVLKIIESSSRSLGNYRFGEKSQIDPSVKNLHCLDVNGQSKKFLNLILRAKLRRARKEWILDAKCAARMTCCFNVSYTHL